MDEFGRRFMPVLLAMLALISIPRDAAAGSPPHRIVSANLCADRLVLQLADRGNIVSVSHYATDATMSTVVAEAAGIRPNRADTEEIVALHPDLVVLGSSHTSRIATAMLRSLEIPVHALPVASSVAGVIAAIRGVATALGVPERGERMIAAMNARLAALPPRSARPRAAVYLAGGWSSGRGSLADDLLGRAGFANLAAEQGLKGLGALPLERLIASAPALIVFEGIGDSGPSLAGALLDNPVIAASGARILRMPARLWACPDPAIAEAAALIAQVDVTAHVGGAAP
jgi:iron complex transport system substrate-binding protein